MEYTTHVHPSNPVNPYTLQLTRDEPVGQGGQTTSGTHTVTIDSPDSRLSEGRAERMGITHMSSFEASSLRTHLRPPRKVGEGDEICKYCNFNNVL